jgi:hypothetical protein
MPETDYLGMVKRALGMSTPRTLTDQQLLDLLAYQRSESGPRPAWEQTQSLNYQRPNWSPQRAPQRGEPAAQFPLPESDYYQRWLQKYGEARGGLR